MPLSSSFDAAALEEGGTERGRGAAFAAVDIEEVAGKLTPVVVELPPIPPELLSMMVLWSVKL